MPRPKKLKTGIVANVDALVGTRGLSKAALQRMLSTLQPGASRWDVEGAHMRRYEQVRCQIDLPSGDGSVAWHLSHPNKALALLVSESVHLQRWFAAALAARPCTQAQPWSLLMGWDEFVPGNKLNPQPRRKTMCLSFSFEELSPYLHLDAAWVTPVAVRSDLIKEVNGGWSAMLKEYLKLQLLGATGIATGGVPLRIFGNDVLIFAKVGAMVSDGDGLRLALEWNGAAGVKPCFRHPNVLSKRGSRSFPGYVQLCCCQAREFELWTAAGLHNMADDLVDKRARYEAGTLPWARVEQAQRAAGYQCTADGLLACAELRPYVDVVKVVRFDWVHTMLDSGALSFAAWNLLELCESLQLASQEGLRQFLELEWHVPRSARYGSRDVRRLPMLFNDLGAQANRSSGARAGIRCSASELLALYGVLQHWVATEVPDDARLARAKMCYNKICAAIDLALQVKRRHRRGSEVAGDMTDLIEEHMALYTHCYGEDAVKPKHHWSFDVAEQIAYADVHLIDAFVIERLHLRARSVADHVTNTSSWEQALCAGILNTHSHALRTRGTEEGLTGASVTCDVGPLKGARVADGLRSAGRALEVDSMVTMMSRTLVGVVIACVEAADGIQYVAVETMEETRPRSHKAFFASRTQAWQFGTPLTWSSALHGASAMTVPTSRSRRSACTQHSQVPGAPGAAAFFSALPIAWRPARVNSGVAYTARQSPANGLRPACI